MCLRAKLGLDPVELRRRNFIANDAFPVTTSVGTVYDSRRLRRRARPRARGRRLRRAAREQQRRRADNARGTTGIGVACYVEITGAMPGLEPARIVINDDGSVTVYTGSTPHGQGHVTSWAMVASERLGIPMDRIEVLFGDTDRDPAGQVTGGSRSAQVCGVVVGRASDLVAEKAKHIAANLLEAAVDDVVLDTDTGRFHVAGTPAIAKSWTEVATAATESLEAEDSFEAVSPTFPFGANVAVIELDTEDRSDHAGAIRRLR
jgi:carbon-monoxide dehydrogenase large subunit